MDESYPIDIHYNKLLDWLVDRRHCDPKWHIQSKAIRSHVAVATSSLPDDNPELTKILQNECMDYFDCREVLEILKRVDGDSKSLFGQFTAPRVKEWAEIRKLYEQGNVYLAESGQQLTRMVNYELPDIRHQMNKCQLIIRDSLRKEEELKTSAANLKEKFEASCKEMGIKGAKVIAELSELVNELPEVYDVILRDLPHLLTPISFYQTFLHTVNERLPDEDCFLPMLSFILKNGNVTVFQWKHGDAPTLKQNLNTRNGNNETDFNIDWGSESGMVSRHDDGIDFGGIDFGDLELEGAEVDLSCITLEDSGDGGVALQGGDGANDYINEKQDYTDDELQLLLENASTRNLFLDDLLELKEFFSHRIHELSLEDIALQMDDFNMESSSESLSEMLSHVTKVLDHMTNKRVQHLFLIKGSQRYLQRLSESLLQNQRLSNRAASQALETAAKREQANITLNDLQPRYTYMVTRTKELQAQIAKEISQIYNSRTVNIMGEINQI